MNDAFTECRSLLFGIAYRMLGRVAEAEDMVQETFLRWQRQDIASIKEPKAWLTTAITRLCIDHMRAASTQREEYYGVWLPEPLVSTNDQTPASQSALADSLGVAFLFMLEELGPVDRAVFLLREAFAYDYSEIASIVDRSEAACRQIVSRAKIHLARKDISTATPSPELQTVVNQFLRACEGGDLQAVLATLTEDVVLYTDGGGVVKSSPRPIRSSLYVGRFLVGVSKFVAVGARHRFVNVNGELGLLTRRPDGVVTVTSFVFVNGRIQTLYVVSNPHKLTSVIAQELI